MLRAFTEHLYQLPLLPRSNCSNYYASQNVNARSPRNSATLLCLSEDLPEPFPDFASHFKDQIRLAKHHSICTIVLAVDICAAYIGYLLRLPND